MISTKNVLIATLFISGTLLALGGITAGTSGALFADEPSSETNNSVEQNQPDTSVEVTQSDTSIAPIQSDNSSEQAVYD